MGVAVQADRKYTVDEWLSWDEDVRCEIIDGELYMMAQPTVMHQRILRKLLVLLDSLLKGTLGEVFCSPFGVRLNYDEQSGFEPDIVVVCDKSKISGGKICEGAPDMVIEILSPSTSRKDRLLKFNKYMQAGVREYWIVDPDDNMVQVNVLENGFYRSYVYGETDTVPVHILDGCKIDLNNVFSED